MTGKSVIVTGAFGALGRVVARTLAAQGATLALVDAAPAAPEALASEFSAHLLLPGVDLTDPGATQAVVAQAAARHRTLDAVVNIAGAFRWETIADGDPTTWDMLFTVNVKTALPCGKIRKGPSVVTVSNRFGGSGTSRKTS